MVGAFGDPIPGGPRAPGPRRTPVPVAPGRIPPDVRGLRGGRRGTPEKAHSIDFCGLLRLGGKRRKRETESARTNPISRMGTFYNASAVKLQFRVIRH